jgi:hypothetical protein
MDVLEDLNEKMILANIIPKPNRADKRKGLFLHRHSAPLLRCARCKLAFLAPAAERCQCSVRRPKKRA